MNNEPQQQLGREEREQLLPVVNEELTTADGRSFTWTVYRNGAELIYENCFPPPSEDE